MKLNTESFPILGKNISTVYAQILKYSKLKQTPNTSVYSYLSLVECLKHFCVTLDNSQSQFSTFSLIYCFDYFFYFLNQLIDPLFFSVVSIHIFGSSRSNPISLSVYYFSLYQCFTAFMFLNPFRFSKTLFIFLFFLFPGPIYIFPVSTFLLNSFSHSLLNFIFPSFSMVHVYPDPLLLPSFIIFCLSFEIPNQWSVCRFVTL